MEENEMDRHKRIEVLRIKLLRKQLCQKWSFQGIIINDENFISAEKTLCLQKKLIDEMKNISNYVIDKSDSVYDIDIKKIFTKYLNEYIKVDQKYVFFEKEATRIGAMVLTGKVILDNEEFVYNESEYSDDCCTLFVFSEDLKNGCCLWETEYNYNIYKW